MRAYLPDIGADSTHGGQKLIAGYPFSGTQTSFSREIVKVTDESLKNIFHTRVLALGVDANCIFCDVVRGQVFQWRSVEF